MKYKVTLNGKAYEVEVEESKVEIVNEYDNVPTPAPVPAAQAPATQTSPSTQVPTASGTRVDAPLPGTVVDVKVSVGQSVKKGDILVIIEAMKMENEIAAPSDGKVAQIVASKGASVKSGDALIVLG